MGLQSEASIFKFSQLNVNVAVIQFSDHSPQQLDAAPLVICKFSRTTCGYKLFAGGKFHTFPADKESKLVYHNKLLNKITSS